MSVEAGIDLIQHPELLGPREMPESLVRAIVERKIVCSMLVSTMTGDAWKKHLKDREEAAKKRAEAEKKAGSPQRPKNERRVAAASGRGRTRARDAPQECSEADCGRRRRHDRHRQLLGGGAGVLTDCQARDPGSRHRQHHGDRRAGRAGHDAGASDRRGDEERRNRIARTRRSSARSRRASARTCWSSTPIRSTTSTTCASCPLSSGTAASSTARSSRSTACSGN